MRQIQFLCSALAVLALGAHTAAAVEIKVMSSVAYDSVLKAVVPMFEKTSGDTVVVDYNSAAMIGQKIEAGEAFDVAIVTAGGLAALTQKGFVAENPQEMIGVSIASLAYRSGKRKPDIMTPAALRSVLLKAKAISISDPKLNGASAKYFLGLVQQLGITNEVEAKLIPTKAGQGAYPVGDGRAPIGIALTSEIAATPNVMGEPLSNSDPKSRLTFAAGISAKSKETTAAKAFVALLASSKVMAIRAAKGFFEH